MNSVSGDGIKFRQWKPQLERFKSYINLICKNHGITPISRIFGHDPVDNLDLLELTEDEFRKVYGGAIMKTENYITTPSSNFGMYDTDCYSDEYDDDYSIETYGSNSPDNILLSKRKDIYLGNTFNLKVDSMEQANEFIQKNNYPNISVQGLKYLMDQLGNDIAYHIGNEFNVDVCSKDYPNVIDADYEDTD
jgi:hypothetical protein